MVGNLATAPSTSAFPLSRHDSTSFRKVPSAPHLRVQPAPQSLHQACPGSKTNLSQPHLLPRETPLHRLPLSVLLPYPQSHATLGCPVPLPQPPPCQLLSPHCQTPRWSLRHDVPKTTFWQMLIWLELNPSFSLDLLALPTWMEDRSVVHLQGLGGYYIKWRGQETQRALSPSPMVCKAVMSMTSFPHGTRQLSTNLPVATNPPTLSAALW